MKITQLRATQPDTPGAPSDWRTQLGQIVVEVTTDVGLTGIGVGGGGAAGIHVVHTVLADLLVGRSPTPVGELHAEMVRHTAFYGRKGLAVMALSGVDLALWDLAGKIAEQPVARLLNKQVDLRQKLPTYVTVFDDNDTAAAVAQGHAGIKLHVERFGLNADAISQQVRQLRDLVGGDVLLMMDAFGEWDLQTTLDVAEAVRNEDVKWIEEPLPPHDFEGYRILAESSPVPIAGGEHEYLEEGFQDIAARGMHRILQPDVNWCGGLTTLLQVYEIAQQQGLQVCPHRGCEPYALHAIVALDPQPLAESPRSWFNCLNGYPPIVDGQVQLGEGAGFGVGW